MTPVSVSCVEVAQRARAYTISTPYPEEDGGGYYCDITYELGDAPWCGCLAVCAYRVTGGEPKWTHPRGCKLLTFDGGTMVEYSSSTNTVVSVVDIQVVRVGNILSGTPSGRGLCALAVDESMAHATALSDLMRTRAPLPSEAGRLCIPADDPKSYMPYQGFYPGVACHYAAHWTRSLHVDRDVVQNMVERVMRDRTPDDLWASTTYGEAAVLAEYAVLLPRTLPYVADGNNDTHYMGLPDGGDCEDLACVVAGMLRALWELPEARRCTAQYRFFGVACIASGGGEPELHTTVVVMPRDGTTPGVVAEATNTRSGVCQDGACMATYGPVVHVIDLQTYECSLVCGQADAATTWGVQMGDFLRQRYTLATVQDNGHTHSSQLVPLLVPAITNIQAPQTDNPNALAMVGGVTLYTSAQKPLRHRRVHQLKLGTVDKQRHEHTMKASDGRSAQSHRGVVATHLPVVHGSDPLQAAASAEMIAASAASRALEAAEYGLAVAGAPEILAAKAAAAAAVTAEGLAESAARYAHTAIEHTKHPRPVTPAQRADAAKRQTELKAVEQSHHAVRLAARSVLQSAEREGASIAHKIKRGLLEVEEVAEEVERAVLEDVDVASRYRRMMDS